MNIFSQELQRSILWFYLLPVFIRKQVLTIEQVFFHQSQQFIFCFFMLHQWAAGFVIFLKIELVTPMKVLHPLFHDSRMTSFEFRHLSHISIIVNRGSRGKHFIGGIHSPVYGFQRLGFTLHRFGGTYPAIVKNPGIDGFHGQFFGAIFILVAFAVKIRNFSKGLSCPERMDFREVANDPDFLLIPAMLMREMVVVSIKVDIIEKESFYAMVIQPLFTLLDDYWKIIFMNHFIGLHIYEPVPGACFLGDVRLMGVFRPAGEFFQIPYGIDNFYFIGLQR